MVGCAQTAQVFRGIRPTLCQRYYLFSYHLICDGFHPTVTTEYVLVSANTYSIVSLSDDKLRQLLITDIENGKKTNISLDDFDSAHIAADSEMDKRCNEHMRAVSSKNNIKINARIEAINYLCRSNCERYHAQMVGASDKEQKRLSNLVQREHEKTTDQIKRLEEKKKFSVTHEFQSICIISVY